MKVLVLGAGLQGRLFVAEGLNLLEAQLRLLGGRGRARLGRGGSRRRGAACRVGVGGRLRQTRGRAG